MKTVEKKEPYLNILDIRGNIYEEFIPDQVLTHKNLNKLVDYFEDKDRLSRIYLSGVGIGCGLNIISFTKQKIEIGQGFGITTDGDLIKTETSEFLYYSELLDRSEYPLFKGIEVFEIHTQEGAGRLSGELPLSSFSNLNECMVLAFMENYTEDEGLCGGLGCDDTGNKVYANTKFLIIHRDHYQKLITDDTIYKSHHVLAYYDGLPELCIPRLLLNRDNTGTVLKVHNLFKDCIYSNNLVQKLNEAIITILSKLNHRLNFEKFGITKDEINLLFQKLFDDQADLEKDIQYKYDLLKDLLETYGQIRDLLLHIHFECVPAIGAFQKHLLLGTLNEKTRLQTRHRFYPSPIVSGNDENLKSVRTLCIKFFNQLKEYKFPQSSSAEIKIIPSKDYSFPLSERSIPYYYQTKKSLVRNWNPEDGRNRKWFNQLGYHKSNLANTDCVQNPLKFSHLDKNFYRIEGHLGKGFKNVLERIIGIKRDYNLPFDVKAVSVGFPVSRINLNDGKCNTKSFSLMLQTWEKEFLCSADKAINFFNQYKITRIGENFTEAKVLKREMMEDKPMEMMDRVETPTRKTNKKALKKSRRKAPALKKDSLGFMMKNVSSGLVSRLYNPILIENMVLEILTEKQQPEVSKEEHFFYVSSPVKIISNLVQLKRAFITDLNSVYQTDKWMLFQSALDKLCTDLNRIVLAVSKSKEKSKFGTRLHDKMYEYLIYDLLKLCCYKEKFIWIREQLDDIREDLYRDIILKNLIRKHPGIEHMAGVPKGGTFIMVYVGEIGRRKKSFKKFRRFNGEVVFDFALPYMCCSDRSPDTIVFHQETKIPEDIHFEPNIFCIVDGSTAEEVSIEVQPEEAVLSSSQGTKFIEGEPGNYMFNPNKVAEDLLGVPIQFEVDERTVESMHATVYKLPKEVAAHYEVKEWKDEGIVVDLIGSHGLEDKIYFSYQWLRADGTTLATSRKAENVLISHTDKTINESITLMVKVADNQVDCFKKATITVEERRPDTIASVSIVPKEFCFIEGQQIDKVPINVLPERAVLTSDQGTVFIEGVPQQYQFNPNVVPRELLGKPIGFKVDGQQLVNPQVQVFALPKRITVVKKSVVWKASKLTVTYEANMGTLSDKDYYTYRWRNVSNSWNVVSNAAKGLISRVITTNADKFTDEIILEVGLKNPNLPCKHTGKIKLSEIKPALAPCQIPFKTRMDTLKVDQIISGVKNPTRRTKLLREVLLPLTALQTNLNRAIAPNFSNASFLKLRLTEINKLRKILSGNYINNRELLSLRLHFLRVDEVLELLGLELMRCISQPIAKKVQASLKAFFNFTKISSLAWKKLRRVRQRIRNPYIKGYVPKSTIVKTLFKSQFKVQ